MSSPENAVCDAQDCDNDASRKLVVADAFSDGNTTRRCEAHADILRQMADPDNEEYGNPHEMDIVSEEPL